MQLEKYESRTTTNPTWHVLKDGVSILDAEKNLLQDWNITPTPLQVSPYLSGQSRFISLADYREALLLITAESENGI